MTRRWLTFVLLGFLLLATRSARASSIQHWIVTSDVHFDPFTDAHLASRLNAAPVERWRGIFQSAGLPFSHYGTDTDYPLLESALDSMRNQDPNPPIVIVAGDFLGHDFRKKFVQTIHSSDEGAYEAFVNKTIAFLAAEFRGAFPRAQFLPVLGNNDSYCGDYQGAPASPFLAHVAANWATSAPTPDLLAWIRQFSVGGYYEADLPVGGARAIVLNDVFWSSNYTNPCGKPGEDPGGDEMSWFRSALAAAPRGPLWVIAHIPPGPDVYTTLQNAAAGKGTSMFLDAKYNDAFLSALVKGGVTMSIAGHTHMNAFRVIGPDSSTPIVPMLLVPAISPAFAGNPSYDIVDVDGASAAVADYRVFVLDDLAALSRDPRHAAKWRREYDFDGTFGGGAVDAHHLDAVEQAMFVDGRVRARFEQFYDGESGRASIDERTWRAYWCGSVALTMTSYDACAMPQVQRSLPPQPSAPPVAASPAPSPTRSP